MFRLDQYPAFGNRIGTANASYPHGYIVDKGEGANSGTPLLAAWANNYGAFFQALLREVNMTPNGDIDTAVDNQALDALKVLINEIATTGDGFKSIDDRFLKLGDQSATAYNIGLKGNGVDNDGGILNNYLKEVGLRGGGKVVLYSPVHASILTSGLEEAPPTESYSFYINNSVNVPSNVQLEFLSPVLYGPFGRIRMFGKAVESDMGEGGQGRISATVLAGATRLPMDSSHPNSDLSLYPINTRLVIRGENDAFGESLNPPDRPLVVGHDVANNELIISPPLKEDYEPFYVNSEYQPGGDTNLDRTTIGIIVSSPLASDANISESSIEVTVGTAGLFPKDSYILLQDEEYVTDYIDTVQPSDPNVTASANLYRREIRRVVDVDTVNDILYLDAGVAHTYRTAHSATVQLVDPVQNSSIKGLRGYFDYETEPESKNHHSVEIAYAAHCSIKDCFIGGGGKSQGFRVYLSMNCDLENNTVLNPAYSASGQGYGLTLYASNGCRVRGFYGSGCRHTVLLFSGACNNIISDVISYGATISDIDFHGAWENNNTVYGVLCISDGRQTTDFVTNKTAIKLGNTYHLVGSNGNKISNILVLNFNQENFTSRAIQILPLSEDNVISDVVAYRCEYGIYGEDLWRGVPSPLTHKGNIIKNCTFFDTSKNSVFLDSSVNGSTFDTATNITLEDITDIRSAKGIYIKQANNVIVDRFKSIESAGDTAPGGTSFVITAEDVTSLKVINSRLEGSSRGFKFTNCPGFIVQDVSFNGIVNDTVFEDGGGNDNYHWLDVDYPNTPDARFVSLSSSFAKERHKEQVYEHTIAGSTSNTVFTDSGPFTDSDPTSSDGREIASGSITPTNPTAYMRIKAYAPAVKLVADDTIVMALFNGSSFIGVTVQSGKAGDTLSLKATGSVTFSSKSAKTLSARMWSVGGGGWSYGGVFGTDSHPYMVIDQKNRQA